MPTLYTWECVCRVAFFKMRSSKVVTGDPNFVDLPFPIYFHLGVMRLCVWLANRLVG